MLSSLVEKLLAVHGIWLYVLVGAFVFAEDAIFVGFVIPGETAAIIGGVAASRGNGSLAALCVIVVLAAALGDTIGYAIGARYGDRLLKTQVLQKRIRRLDRAREYLRRRGGPAVFAGRFIAFLRAVTPFLAGTSHMQYRKFFAYNFAGALIWGIGSVVLGYFAGDSYKAIERVVGSVAAAIFGVIVVAGLIVWQVRRHRRANREDDAET